MTRINTVDPECLSDKHLIAEYRELPRIFKCVRDRVEKGYSVSDISIPASYCLGKGHMTFFYDKLLFLVRRQESIVRECLSRGFKIQFTDPSSLIHGIPSEFCNDWVPDIKAVRINLKRIKERS